MMGAKAEVSVPGPGCTPRMTFDVREREEVLAKESFDLFCSSCLAKDPASVLDVWLPPRDHDPDAKGTFVRLCLPCARAVALPVPIGKEARRGPKVRRMTVKRYTPNGRDDMPMCKLGCEFVVGQAVAAWSGGKCAIVCVPCADRMLAAIKAARR